MGKTETPVVTKTEAPKRKMLTDAERVARLEAELAAARKKAEAKTNKVKHEAAEKRAKLVEKRDALNDQIHALTEVIGDGDFFAVAKAPADENAA